MVNNMSFFSVSLLPLSLSSQVSWTAQINKTASVLTRPLQPGLNLISSLNCVLTKKNKQENNDTFFMRVYYAMLNRNNIKEETKKKYI